MTFLSDKIEIAANPNLAEWIPRTAYDSVDDEFLSNAVDEEEVHTFGTLTAIRSDGSEEVIELSPPRAAPGTTLRVDLGDNLEVIEGRIYRNGELLPEIDPQHMQDLKQDLNQSEIDMGTQIAKFESGQAMLIHDNLDLVATDLAGVELCKPLIQAAIEALGGNRELVFEYFRSVMKVFQRLRDTVAATFPEFEDSQVLDVNLSNVPSWG